MDLDDSMFPLNEAREPDYEYNFKTGEFRIQTTDRVSFTKEEWKFLTGDGGNKMTRQELAESMAEFLDMELDGECLVEEFKDGVFKGGRAYTHIFSPDAFFAVWDKVEGKLKGTNLTFNHIPENSNVYCTIVKQYPHSEWGARTKDRYHAFYEAVHKMKGGE